MTTPELPPLPPLSAQCFWFLSEEGADQVRGYAEAYARTALAPLEAEVAAMRKDALRVPEGLARSDAQFWLDRRTQIIEACRAAGVTIVTTAQGVHLMKLGKVEAQDAAIDSAMNTKGESA